MNSGFELSRRAFLKVAAAGLGATALGIGPLRVLGQSVHAGSAAANPGERVTRPNILHIMTDDQDYQSWAEPFTRLDEKGSVLVDESGEPARSYAMSFVRSMPSGGWCDFTQNTCTSAICAPARAGLLTGVPSRENGVTRNGLIDNLDESNTLAVWLSAAGYKTHLVGKYSFGRRARSRPQPPGWTTFNGRGGMAKWVFAEGVRHVHAMAGDSAPWAMFLWPTDPHRPAHPTPQNARVKLLPPPLPANINEEDVSDKPAWVRNTKPLSPGKLQGVMKERVRSYQAVMGVDQGIESVFNALVETGQLDNTIILVTSDNGDSWGSHRQLYKDMIYDEAARVPLVVRLPWLTENRTENRVVSQLDITATIVEVTGVTPGRPLMGSSFLRLMEEPEMPWEGVAYIESHGSSGPRSKNRPAFRGLRTGGDFWGQFSYAEYPDTGEIELYDRAADPTQLRNVAGQPEYAEIRAALAAKLAEYLSRPAFG